MGSGIISTHSATQYRTLVHRRIPRKEMDMFRKLVVITVCIIAMEQVIIDRTDLEAAKNPPPAKPSEKPTTQPDTPQKKGD